MANPLERFGSRVHGVRRLGREDEVQIVNRAARNSAEAARADGNRNSSLDQKIELLGDTQLDVGEDGRAVGTAQDYAQVSGMPEIKPSVTVDSRGGSSPGVDSRGISKPEGRRISTGSASRIHSAPEADCVT